LKTTSPISLLLICSLTLSLLAFHVPRVWAWDWALERPNNHVYFNDEHIHDAGTTDKVSVGLGVQILEYDENSLSWPFEGGDGLTIRAVASGNARKIIDYSVSGDEYCWHDNLSHQLILGDDECGWIDTWGRYEIKTRFYGGVGSAEYDGVWVSSNGVLFFNDSCTDPYYSPSIPDRADPDNFVAPFWRDLKPNWRINNLRNSSTSVLQSS